MARHADIWPHYGGIVVFDPSAEHEVVSYDPMDSGPWFAEHGLVFWEVPQDDVLIRRVDDLSDLDGQPSDLGHLHVRSGQIAFGSSEGLSLDEEIAFTEPVAAGWYAITVVEEAPTRYAIHVERLPDAPTDPAHGRLRRIGIGGRAWREREARKRAAAAQAPPVATGLAPEQQWSDDRLTLRYGPLQGRRAPRLQVTFLDDGGTAVHAAEALPIRFRDDHAEYELWLVGPRQGCTRAQVEAVG